MRIDSHCHIDLFNDPIATARAYDNAQIGCVMATLLPSHYQVALSHLKPFKEIQPALGMHPLRVNEGLNEIKLFKALALSAEYFGEIGLDFSAEGQSTKGLQLEMLRSILPSIGKGKFVTVHSRNAHTELSNILDEFNVGPVCFHYFIGGPFDAEKLISRGHYFSINHLMLKNRHRDLINSVPRDRILVESDGPFLTRRPWSMVDQTYNELGTIWHIDKSEVDELLTNNFKNCRTRV